MKFLSSIGSDEFPVDELLRNLGVGIASFPHHHNQVQVAPYWSAQEFYLHLDRPMVWVFLG